MVKFNYRLEPLLNIKIQKEDLIKMKLSLELQKLYIEKQKLAMLTDKNKKQISNYMSLITSGVSINKIRNHNNYICRLKRMIDEQNKNINIIAENVDKIREELIKETQDRKTLEKLRERKITAYKEELLREEQKQNDEIISYRQNMVLAVEG